MLMKFFRLLKILRVTLRYGIDEIALSGLKVPRTMQLLEAVMFWRDLSAPRGERLRKEIRRAHV